MILLNALVTITYHHYIYTNSHYIFLSENIVIKIGLRIEVSRSEENL